MSKRSKNQNEELPAGMSRRQAKLAARAAERAALDVDPRPFKDFALEQELVALQEFVPSAYMKVTLKNGVDVTIASIIPGAQAAAVQKGPVRYVGMQTQSRSNNPSKDLACSLEFASSAEEGQGLGSAVSDSTVPTLKDLLDPKTTADLTVEQDFTWWLSNDEKDNPQAKASIEQANASVLPTHKVDADVTGSAWWIDPGEKAHIRWIRPDDEETLLNGLARVAAAGNLQLGENTKFAGVFRTHGLIVPVFDLPVGGDPQSYASELVRVDKELTKAFKSDGKQLSAEERKAKQNINSRQVTLR